MNNVNFNISTPNVNYARLKDESTDKPTEQVNFKCKGFKYRKENMLNKDRLLAKQREIAIRKSVGLFFRNLGALFKNIGKKNKEVSRNQKVIDFSSDAAKYFELKKLGKNTEAEIYKERMRRFLEE